MAVDFTELLLAGVLILEVFRVVDLFPEEPRELESGFSSVRNKNNAVGIISTMIKIATRGESTRREKKTRHESRATFF